MTREVSRRTSRPPETKAKVSRPDVVGMRDLDPKIVEDRPDPAINAVMPFAHAQARVKAIIENIHKAQQEINEITGIARTTGYRDNNNGSEIQRGKDMDQYLNKLGPQVDEKPKRRK